MLICNSGRLFLALLLLVLGGCAVTAQQHTDGSEEKRVQLVENRSVDFSVRRKFEKALELLNEKQYEQAIDLLKQVAAETSNNSAPYINLGIAYSKIEKPELAEENFNKALAINPDHPVTINELAVFYRGTGKFSEARNLYERVVIAHPEFMPARKNFGILCDLYLNDPVCALEQYEVYYQANPKDEKVKLWIATLRQKLDGK